MSARQPDRGKPKAPDDDVPLTDRDEMPETPVVPHQRGVPRTRWSAAWLGICAAAVVSIILIVFMLQNTRSVEVSFLWLHGTLPLALALLIAAVGSAILTMVVGTARITQLHRLVGRRRDQRPR